MSTNNGIENTLRDTIFPFLVDENEKFNSITMECVKIGSETLVAEREVCIKCGGKRSISDITGFCGDCISEGKATGAGRTVTKIAKTITNPDTLLWAGKSVPKINTTPVKNSKGKTRFGGNYNGNTETAVMNADQYIKEFGSPVKYKGGGVSERTMKLWTDLLAIKSGEYLVIRCGSRDPNSMRSTLHNSMTRMIKLTNSDFKVRAISNKVHNHVAMWKMSKVDQ
jgi:hypothetical protein